MRQPEATPSLKFDRREICAAHRPSRLRETRAEELGAMLGQQAAAVASRERRQNMLVFDRMSSSIKLFPQSYIGMKAISSRCNQEKPFQHGGHWNVRIKVNHENSLIQLGCICTRHRLMLHPAGSVKPHTTLSSDEYVTDAAIEIFWQ